MSAGPEPQVDIRVIEQERRRLSQRLDEVARLCEADVPPHVFFGELLKKLLESLAAPAGVIWARTPQGNLQMQFQINLKEVGLDRSEQARQTHDELLRHVVNQPRPVHLLPNSGLGSVDSAKVAPGNPTDLLLLLVPMTLNNQVIGLIEIWQGSNRPLNAVPGFLQYMGLMAELAVRYQRNQMVGQLAGQQQLWTQLETFARQIHASLNPIEVAYQVANEGRRLIACDRVSVGVRYGKKVAIEAISGADMVEKRSNLVRLMRTLTDKVLTWGEQLVFNGVKDDSLPPPVLAALDAYLAESGTKLLVVQPLRDEREKDSKKPARSALVMECFEPPEDAQPFIARMEVIGKHAASALYNSVEYRRIPGRMLWLPLAKVQEGLGGKGKMIGAGIVAGLALLVSVLTLVPYPLKMEATGNLLPQVRYNVYSTMAGKVREFNVNPNEAVDPDRVLGVLENQELGTQIRKLRQAINDAAIVEQGGKVGGRPTAPGGAGDRNAELLQVEKARIEKETKLAELDALIALSNAERKQEEAGRFYLRAPKFTDQEARLLKARTWKVLSTGFKEGLTNKEVRPSEELFMLGAVDGPWEIQLRIPQQHMGQILRAYQKLNTKELEVDFLLKLNSERTFKGRLSRDKIGGEAKPAQNEHNESEPVVPAAVQIEVGDGPGQVPRHLLVSGSEVHAKVRCGNERMGYSLFYGVWEFFYEKVVFFF